MEDFSPILWILLFGGAFVFSIISQRKQVGKAENTENEPHNQEAWPSWDPMAAPKRLANNDQPELGVPESQYATESEAPRPGFGQMVQSTTDRMEDAMQAQTTRPLELTQSQLSAAEAPSDADTELSMRDIQTEIAENFDLRRAVIYSEILKPKFDECEQ